MGRIDLTVASWSRDFRWPGPV